MPPHRTARPWKKAVSGRDSNACSTASQAALNARIDRKAAHRVGGPAARGAMSIDPDAPDHRVSALRSYHEQLGNQSLVPEKRCQKIKADKTITVLSSLNV